MPLKMTLMPQFVILYLQPFQNGGLQATEVEAELASVNVGLRNFVYANRSYIFL
jgi:hypothetical protein